MDAKGRLFISFWETLFLRCKAISFREGIAKLWELFQKHLKTMRSKNKHSTWVLYKIIPNLQNSQHASVENKRMNFISVVSVLLGLHFQFPIWRVENVTTFVIPTSQWIGSSQSPPNSWNPFRKRCSPFFLVREILILITFWRWNLVRNFKFMARKAWWSAPVRQFTPGLTWDVLLMVQKSQTTTWDV